MLLYRGANEYLQRQSRAKNSEESSDLNRIFANDPRISPDITAARETEIHSEDEDDKSEEILTVRL